jgi:hypothetical protein
VKNDWREITKIVYIAVQFRRLVLMKFKKANNWLRLPLFLCVLVGFSCHRHIPKPPEEQKPHPISVKSILNIPFIEVRRRLKSGLSFDNQGFEAEPFYRITFLSADTARILNPMDGNYYNFYIFKETDSIFNVARSYFKMIQMSRDSMKFQVMQVEGDTLHMQRSLVYMTFYSKNYLQNVLHTTAEALGKPDHRDTLFIQRKSELANRIPDSAFAARQPATIKSINPLAKVQMNEVKPDVMNNFDASDAYMNPEFNITINKAYENFGYSFWAFVDDKGKLSYDHSAEFVEPEFKESTDKTIKAIVDGYLSVYLKVTPGSTLGIKHTSRVLLNLVGYKK